MVSVKVGEVFYESWGYDQTNIDFLQVVEVSPTGKTVLCQMMGKADAGEDRVTPSKAYGIKFRLHVRTYREAVSLVGKYPFIQGTHVKCLVPEAYDGAFKCLRLRFEDTDKIRFWSNDGRRRLCAGCVNFAEAPDISYRDDGGFSRYEHPMFETPLGMGH